MIKAVFFDLDGTLYDRNAFVTDLLSDQFEVFRTELDGVGKSRFVERILELDAHGHGNKLEAYQSVGVKWGLSQEVITRLLEHFWLDYDGRYRVDPAVPRLCLSDDTQFTLRTLRQNRKKLGIITNGETTRQQRKLELLGISDAFDTILISESEGVRKPDLAIFQRALERCGVEPCQALFVGDHPEVDVAGARCAGLTAIWKFVPYWTLTTENVMTVHRLEEILPVCLAE